MSQAPVFAKEYKGADRIFAEATAELNRQVDEGTSWSGNERNNVFLNLGSNLGEEQIPQFAEISAVAGFDFPDDSRGLVSLDWDFDGDLDFITSNRTAPRVRIFENRLVQSSDSSVSIQLIGSTANRDAIGSRVELTVTDRNDLSIKLERTLHGGQGFLSQSSKRLHFGIPADFKISAVTVFWNSRDAEEIVQYPSGAFWSIEQGTGMARDWQVSKRSSPKLDLPSPAVEDDPSATVIANLSRPIPLPAIPYTDAAGNPLEVKTGREKIMIVNLWATWCPACLQELSEFSKNRTLFEDCDFLALCVDASPDDPEMMAEAQRILKETGFAFETGYATDETLQLIHSAHNTAFVRPSKLPVPTTLILAPGSRIATVIRGQIEPSTLEPLLSALRAGGDTWDRYCEPAGPGRWVHGPDTIYYVGIAKEMIERGELKQASDFLQSQQKWLKPEGRNLAEILMLTGTRNLEKGEVERGIELLKNSVEIEPSLAPAQNNLAVALLQKDRGNEAVPHLRAAIAADPGFSDAKVNLARFFAATGEHDQALALVEPILKADYHPGAIRVKAQVMVARGQSEELGMIFQKMVQHEPNNPGNWVNLGKLQLSQGSRSEAVFSFEKAAALAPSDTNLRAMIDSLKATGE